VNPWGVERREVPAATVGLTSLLDVLVILVLFLLSFLGHAPEGSPLAADLDLPRSTSVTVPSGDVRVRVTRHHLSVNGVPVLDLEEGPAGPEIPASFKDGRLVPLLGDRLAGVRSGGFPGADAPLLLEGDEDLPFSVLREVMYTARKAGFQDFHLLVLGSGTEPSTGGVSR